MRREGQRPGWGAGYKQAGPLKTSCEVYASMNITPMSSIRWPVKACAHFGVLCVHTEEDGDDWMEMWGNFSETGLLLRALKTVF